MTTSRFKLLHGPLCGKLARINVEFERFLALALTETLYEGPAHDATFYVPSAGVVRFVFSDPLASGYVYALPMVPWRGSMERVQPEARLFLSAGQYVLTLYDPNQVALVSIAFEPH